MNTVNFTTHPFGLTASCSNYKTVNKLLEFSLRLQKKEGLSNAAGIVTIVLKRCFDAIGIESTIVSGVAKSEYYNIPHLWLSIEEQIVDNTFVEDMALEHWIMFKLSNIYEVGVDESQNLFLGDEETRAHGIGDHDLEQFKWLLANHDKTLTLGNNKKQIGSYWKIMKEFMKSEFQSDVEDNSLMLSKTCWVCQHKPEVVSQLKKCGLCKIAKYCSKVCQRKDWTSCHKKICIPPNSF